MKSRPKRYQACVKLALLAWLTQSQIAMAGPREQAYRLHNRLAGVPPSPEILTQMEGMLAQGDGEGAAQLAMENFNFYNVTLKHWASPWTNKDESVRVELNDYVATVIGMVRDNVPFDQILYSDILYTANGTAGIPAYSPANNTHYTALETQAVNLKTALVKGQQSILNPAVTEVSGALSTRAFGAAFFEAGTNRAAIRSSFVTFLCQDMEQMSDTSTPDFRVRRDVDRQPGGDAKVYRNKCAGCHAGIDALGGAFAHFDWDGSKVVNNPATVSAKFAKNVSTFPDGFVTTDNNWMNLWTDGQNTRIGWQGTKSGKGIQQYGQMLAATEAFPLCMAKRVYSSVCVQDIKSLTDVQVAPLADSFKADSYNLKNLFAAAALQCIGD